MLTFQKFFLAKLKLFQKVGQTPRSSHEVKIVGTHENVSFLEYRYSSKLSISSIYCSKVISKIELFEKYVKLKDQGHRIKSVGTHGKVVPL